MGATDRSSLRRRLALLVFLAVIAAQLVGVHPAAAQDVRTETAPSTPPSAPLDPPKPSDGAAKPADTSTKHASLSMGVYGDTDHVTVFTPTVSGSVDNVTDGASVSGSYLVDVVSAASVDIVSTASRRWHEVRQAGTLTAQYKPRAFGVQVAGSTSVEPDYLSYGVGAQVTHDFDEKNLTLLFGYGYGNDTIGRSGTPFSVFSRTVNRGSFTGGVTRVINPTTVLGLALDVIIENGDQSKPYRYVPMFSADVAANVPNGASIDYVNSHRLFERPLEQLPLSRRRFATTARLAHRFDASTLRLEERFYADSWAMLASTTDVRWIFDLSRRVSVWPHARFHGQSAVSFWKRAYVSKSATGWDLPQYRTGDRELGPLWTLGGGGGIHLGLGSAADPRRFGISLEGDAMYTSFLDDLYITNRFGGVGVLSLEGEL